MQKDKRHAKEHLFDKNSMFHRTAVKDHVLRAESLPEGCDCRLVDEWEEIMKILGLKEREYAAAVDKRGPGGYLEDRTE
jgi:hypothetical protein